MLASQFRCRALPRIKSRWRTSSRVPIAQRGFGTESSHYSYALPPLRIAGPIIWCIGACGTIYFTCAVIDVWREARANRRRNNAGSYDELSAARHRDRTLSSRFGISDTASSPLNLWSRLPETDKVIVGNIALNTSLWISSRAAGAYFPGLEHMPIGPRNYTMLTSTFGHAGPLHLAINMYCVYAVGRFAADSPSFRGNAPHLSAFYLSSGILSSLVCHLESAIPSRRFTSAMGASGAVSAFIGVFGMSYPDAPIRIMFLPGTWRAQDMLGYLALFETYGFIFGIPFLGVAHGSHLGGLAVGCAYVYFDGSRYLWEPTRRMAFRGMRALNLI